MRNTTRVFSVMSAVLILALLWATPGFARETETQVKTKKQINIFGTFGMATSQLEDALLDFGVEFQLVKGFYARVAANSHLDVGRNRYYDDYSGLDYGYYHGYYGVGFGLNDGTTVHGVSAYGVYKAALGKSLNLSLLAGLSYLSYWRQTYDSNEDTVIRNRRRGYGGGLGAAIEYYLSEKLGIIFGGTYRKLFESQTPQYPDEPLPDKPSWVHLYLGFSYSVKGIKL